MKQVVQNYRTGDLRVEDVPAPVCRSGGIVVRTAYSLVSAGTERMKISQARMNLIQMAKARPEKVRQVVQSCKQVGILETMTKVRERLDALTPLGYSLSGIVEEVGPGIDEFQVGDRVVCAGEGIACHAEFVSVPRNLCARVPDGVSLEDAAFATVGAIALQGVRQSGATIGDHAVVIGLGLVGLLAVQVLKAAGCEVTGVDVDEAKLELARRCGADRALARDDSGLEEVLRNALHGYGPDIVYIAASTKSDDPMQLAGRVLRDRGKVVIVGMVPVNADWQTYYQKELSVIMSRSYGPGRYDPAYEQKGVDYPIGYVRWTLGRNLQTFLYLVDSGSVKPERLAPEIIPIENAVEAYDRIHENPQNHASGLIFKYPHDAPLDRVVDLPKSKKRDSSPCSRVSTALIGAGNFTTGTLIPALKRINGVDLKAICSAGGLSARSAGERHGFDYCTSEVEEILEDDSIDAVVIATRHSTHAQLTARALRAGKNVFVEKPLALTREQLDDVIEAQAETGLICMPGFNRRFSPLSQSVRDFFAQRNTPIEVIYRVNAGAIGSESWYQDAEEGGWRIISEGCHFVDLIQHITGYPAVRVSAQMIGGKSTLTKNDNCVATLTMRDGSLGSLIYIANGDAHFEKERIEVFGQGKTAVIENWHRTSLCSNGKTKRYSPKGTGKGHVLEMEAFIEAVRQGRPSPIPFDEAVRTTLLTFEMAASMVARDACEHSGLTG